MKTEMKVNEKELDMNELNMINGGGVLDTICDTFGWTYRNIVKPVGEYVYNTVKEVIELPIKPLKDKLDELRPQPYKPVKPIDNTFTIGQADR